MMEVASGFFGDGSWKLLRKLPVPLAPPDLPACDSNWKRLFNILNWNNLELLQNLQ